MQTAHPSRALALAKPQSTDQQSTMVTMATVQARACTILVEFERARTELVGEAVMLTNGKAGIVDRLWLDEFHGLRISIRSQEGNWPVSTIKICGAVGSSGRYAQQSCGGASKTAMGQTEKSSVRAYDFRFVLELGHCSMQSALRICANTELTCPQQTAS
jgi:hypothetical protein